VTCKIVDESSLKSGEYVNVLFLARKFEQLPIMFRKGDILRIHRGEFAYFKDLKQIRVNMNYKSSWCLYLGDESSPALESKVDEEDKDYCLRENPYNLSGKSFSQPSDEVKTLRKLWRWIKGSFSKFSFLDVDKLDSLESLKSLHEETKFSEPKLICNLFCRVEAIERVDDYKSYIRFRDHKNGEWNSEIYSRKFPHLKVGDICHLLKVNAYYLKHDRKPYLFFLQKSTLLKNFSFSMEEKEMQKIFDTHDRKLKF
jgi:hypothetical protein